MTIIILLTMHSSTKHELGQYMTTSIELQQTVLDFILNKPSRILEPSVGHGNLVDFITSNNKKMLFDMYEIDDTLLLLPSISRSNVVYADFMSSSISTTYTTIIGNPPYVRTTTGNLYIDFVEKCFRLLDESGELIFIVPSDFFKLTSASKLLNEMMHSGTMTHIYHPHNETLFEHASIDVIVFRYCKNNQLPHETIYNGQKMYLSNNDGLLLFSETNILNVVMFKDMFNIWVGIVSGKEDVYKNAELGNMVVLNGENKLEKYICIDKYPCENQQINTYLLEYKQVLIERGIRKMTEKNWFEWGALRNIKRVEQYMGQECIYIYNITRREIVAFKGTVGYFGGGLLMLMPKNQGMCLTPIVNYLNSDYFKNNFMFSGRFKLGHRGLSNSFIPNEVFEHSA
jgi:adenine-specific DNA-methyltransferase